MSNKTYAAIEVYHIPLHASWLLPTNMMCKRARWWHRLLRHPNWSRVILEAMSVHPTLPPVMTALAHVVPLVASARAPDLLIRPAVASLIKEAGCQHHA